MLQEKILRTLEKRDGLDQRTLSKIAGVNESSVSRYLHGFEMLNLASVLKIVQHLYPEQEKEIMAEYVLTQKSRNARFALEYCDLNSMPEQVHKLIESLSVSVNPIDKEWAKLYRFIRNFRDKNTTLEDLLWQVEVFDPKELEMKIMKQILKGYIYVQLTDYTSLTLHTKYTENLIKRVKSEFLRNCFNIRLGLLKNYVCLYANDLKQARHYSNLVLKQNFFENVKPIAYHHLGHSYLFEDYDKSMRYLEKAVALFRELGHKKNLYIAERKVIFLNSYWKKDMEYNFRLDTFTEKSDYIYYLLQKERIDQAKEVFEQIDVSTLSDQEKGYYYYFLGEITKDKTLYYESVNSFRNAGDRFHIILPVEKLRSLGENETILKIFTS